MKKETEHNTPNNTTQETQATANPHPAEVAAEILRKALADERKKTEVLSHHCVRLSTELETLMAAENERADAEAIALANSSFRRRKAERRRRAREKKAIDAYKKACTRNAISLSLATAICFFSAMLGFEGIIHPALAAPIACVSFIAFGWSLNTCINLIGRCE